MEIAEIGRLILWVLWGFVWRLSSFGVIRLGNAAVIGNYFDAVSSGNVVVKSPDCAPL